MGSILEYMIGELLMQDFLQAECLPVTQPAFQSTERIGVTFIGRGIPHVLLAD